MAARNVYRDHGGLAGGSIWMLGSHRCTFVASTNRH